MRLKGKTALITAAGQGMGRAAALAFAAEGAKVWASDVDAGKLAGLTGCDTLVLDVTDAAAVAAAPGRTGPIDILFNCAGYVANGSVLESTRADWDRSMAINVTSMFLTIQAYLPLMLAKGGGRILNMASVAGSIKGIKSRAAYGTSKAAVIGLTKSVAADYIDRGIRCNAICPGTIDTPSLQDRINAYADPIAARRMFVARQPLGRLGTVEEIAELCVYLASDLADFITGQTVIIDGGVSL